ncbi:MAG: pilus assembly protein FimV, partial [Proteobacteria bacterium]|nr:pilus assembly protein FimV [Pseudomonadota bacterium]
EIPGDFNQAGAAAAIDTEEVDPIAEADVYMAYGRDTQAEEILKEALVKDPTRQPVRLKLLEIYAGRKDTATFATVAAELHAGTGGEGEFWQKAATLGLQLDPSNPLYGGTASVGETTFHGDTQVLSGEAAAAAATAAASAPDIALDMGDKPAESPGLDFDLGLGEPAEAPSAPSAEVSESAAVSAAADATVDLGFDLDLGGGEPKPAADADLAAGGTLALDTSAPSVPDAGSSIDFDFELPASGSGEATAEQASAPLEVPGSAPEAPAAPADAGGGIDFDFNLDLPAAKEEAPAASEEASAPLDLSSISLDLGSPGEAAAPADAHWQEVATKLDLAKAYQEMGDKDGARELLNEVLKEGDAAQQQQAQTMLSALG